jgi:hypothetical protein
MLTPVVRQFSLELILARHIRGFLGQSPNFLVERSLSWCYRLLNGGGTCACAA